jgi:hypothetical protein
MESMPLRKKIAKVIGLAKAIQIVSLLITISRRSNTII